MFMVQTTSQSERFCLNAFRIPTIADRNYHSNPSHQHKEN